MREKCLCEKCGSEMIPIKKDSTVGMVCPNCGHGFVTSYIDPIYEDFQEYKIYLTEGNTVTKDNYFLIQSLTNMSMLEIKHLFETTPYLLFKGLAPEVKELKEKLDECSINYSIVPEFKY